MRHVLTCSLIDDREIIELALKEIDDSHLCISANNGIDALAMSAEELAIFAAGDRFAREGIFGQEWQAVYQNLVGLVISEVPEP